MMPAHDDTARAGQLRESVSIGGSSASPDTPIDAKVLYVDWSSGFGGSSKSLALLLSGLPDVGKIMMTAQDPPLVAELFGTIRTWRFRRWVNYRTRARFSELVERNVRLKLLRNLALKVYALVDTVLTGLNTLRLARIIRRHDVDLVHINNGFHPAEAVLAARLTHVPVVGHMRGIATPPFSRSTRRTVLEAGCTIAVSDAAGAALTQEMPEARVITVYDPVDIPRVEGAQASRGAIREELGATDDDLVVGIFGRVVRWKGQLEFIRACTAAMERDSRLLAVIVGSVSDGAQSYFDEVEAVIGASPYRDRFRLTGYRSDVEAMYAAMDVVVHASTSPEPFGMVIPEAMAAGKAVIVANAGGPPEIVTEGMDGLLVPPGDVEAMSAAILRVAADPDLRAAMGARARETVAERFTIERHADEVRGIYRMVLGD
jgi:glycosyltransferase involved in cell wall biosynthesis